MKQLKHQTREKIDEENVSTILFDWDGCLADTLEAWLSSFETAIAPYIPEITRQYILKNNLMADFSLIRQFNLGIQTEEKILTAILKQVHTYGESVEISQDITELLAEFVENKMKLAIVSSAPKSFIQPQLDRFGLAQYFSIIISADDVTHLKPHPEPLEKALAFLQASPESALMIGDTRSDILAGKAAGTRTAVYFPERNEALYDKDDMLALNADYYFRSFLDLKTLLLKNTP